MPHAYILECSDGSYYTGSTRNLEVRLWQHQNGIGCAYTHDRRPVRLVWAQEFPTAVEAWGVERKLHGWSRAKKKALIEGRLDLLPGLSRSRRRPSTSSGSEPTDEHDPAG